MERESSVWSFFTKKAEFLATCNTCNQDYSFRASTSNLRKHWNNKHGKNINEKPSDLSENNGDNSDEEQDKAFADKYCEPAHERCRLKYVCTPDKKQHVQDHGHEPQDSDEEFVPDIQEKKLKRRHKSKLWEFFRATDDKMAECLICHNLFNYSSTITNLRRHLMRKHGESPHPSEDGESKNIITYKGQLYEVVNGQDDDDQLQEMDAVYLNEDELDDDLIYKPPSPKKKQFNIPSKIKPKDAVFLNEEELDDDSIYKSPSPMKKQFNIPSKIKPKITKEQVHSTRHTCSEESELPCKPILTYTPNSMGSLDYFGQYVVSLLKELPKPVSDQLQSEIIKQILTSKMALESQTVVAKYEIVKSRKNETDTNVPEPISYTVVQSNETAENLNEITESVVKE